jgi:hypothetical protein
MPDQRFAADQRDMQGLVLPRQADQAVHKVVAPEIGKFVQGNSTTQVRITIGVTSGAA